MTNTDWIYAALRDYQSARSTITAEYDRGVAELERWKGSQGYNESVKALADKRDAAIKAAKDKALPDLNRALEAMYNAVGSRKITPPTQEQLNTLQLLQMKAKPTQQDFDRVAQSIKDCPMALDILQDMARDNKIHRNYTHLAPELPTNAALEMLDGMRRGIDDFLKHDTTYASRYVDRHRQMTHGYSDPDRLRKRTPFTDKAGCFAEIGIADDVFPMLAGVVDAD